MHEVKMWVTHTVLGLQSVWTMFVMWKVLEYGNMSESENMWQSIMGFISLLIQLLFQNTYFKKSLKVQSESVAAEMHLLSSDLLFFLYLEIQKNIFLTQSVGTSQKNIFSKLHVHIDNSVQEVLV